MDEGAPNDLVLVFFGSSVAMFFLFNKNIIYIYIYLFDVCCFFFFLCSFVSWLLCLVGRRYQWVMLLCCFCIRVSSLK